MAKGVLPTRWLYQALPALVCLYYVNLPGEMEPASTYLEVPVSNACAPRLRGQGRLAKTRIWTETWGQFWVLEEVRIMSNGTKQVHSNTVHMQFHSFKACFPKPHSPVLLARALLASLDLSEPSTSAAFARYWRKEVQAARGIPCLIGLTVANAKSAAPCQHTMQN